MSGQLPTVASNIVTNDQAYHDEGVEGVDALQVQQRYQQERLKRLRPEATNQFVDPSAEEKWRYLIDDPWVDMEPPVKDIREQIEHHRTKVLILGAGYGGLLFAIRFIEVGIKSDDIKLVDTAGGFGGVWYWNRFPGLMCDVESYSYMPLLEETGYIPKNRYAYGPELREYANQIAKQWDLADKGLFQTQVKSLVWEETQKAWRVELVQSRTGFEPQHIEIYSQFVVAASGFLNWPHRQLQDKTVAIVGTGATAVQSVPHLSRWAKHLYVFQRTPSSVDIRGQRETDATWFKKEVANEKSWQRVRNANFHGHLTISKDKPSVNMIDDQWSKLHVYGAIVGSAAAPLRPEELPAYLQELHKVDLARQGAVRKRIKREVTDSAVAKALLPWYPSWCKRPCFHDDYLPSFNRPNVTLVDTKGEGVTRLTTDSVVYADRSYPVDLIVLSTGFRSPGIGTAAERSNMSIVGRDGRTISETWESGGPRTLHGLSAPNFPNLFFPGPCQAGVSPNQTFIFDCMAQHTAYIIAQAKSRITTDTTTTNSTPPTNSITIEPTPSAAESWSNEVMQRAVALAAIRGCTPSYFNLEGEIDRVPEHDLLAQMKAAKGAIWGAGVEDYLGVLERWRDQGGLEGIEIGR